MPLSRKMTRGQDELPFGRANAEVKELKMSSCLFGGSATGSVYNLLPPELPPLLLPVRI